MAALFLDSFDLGDVRLKWDLFSDGFGGLSTPTPGRDGTGRYCAVPDSGYITRYFPAAATTIVGLALRVSGLVASSWTVSLRGDNNATTHLYLRLNASGFIELYLGDGTLLATSAPTNLLANVWYQLQIKATIDNAAGTCVVRLNGAATPIINFTGDTRNGGTAATLDSVTVSAPGSNNGLSVDDVFVFDGTGGINDDFPGDRKVVALQPNGNGNYSQLLGSDGNSVDNYLNVDEDPYNTTDYNGSDVAGDKDTYLMENLAVTIATVEAVQNNMIAAKSDGGTRSARSVLRQGGSDNFGATHALSTSYVTYSDVYDECPTGPAAWSVTNVNNSEAGMEVV